MIADRLIGAATPCNLRSTVCCHCALATQLLKPVLYTAVLQNSIKCFMNTFAYISLFLTTQIVLFPDQNAFSTLKLDSQILAILDFIRLKAF